MKSPITSPLFATFALLILLSSLALIAQDHFAISAALALLSMPIAMYAYGNLHNFFHRPVGNPRVNHSREIQGILLANCLALGWNLYKRHHTNHHKYNNGPKDYSTNLNKKGDWHSGSYYLTKNALIPYLILLIPGAALAEIPKKSWTPLLFIDETLRTLIKLAFYLAFGPKGLAILILWQILFVLQLFYFNYLQHFEVPIGEAVVWQNPLFNHLTLNQGYHDQHHQSPSTNADHLPTIPSRTPPKKTVGVFHPKLFLYFLISPHHLHTQLNKN